MAIRTIAMPTVAQEAWVGAGGGCLEGVGRRRGVLCVWVPIGASAYRGEAWLIPVSQVAGELGSPLLLMRLAKV